MGLLGQSNQNIMSGADRLIGTASGAAASGMFAGVGGGNGSGAAVSGGVPGTYNYSPGLASTSGGGGSPASLFGSVNPAAPLLIGS
jgi:hypothetical protein